MTSNTRPLSSFGYLQRPGPTYTINQLLIHCKNKLVGNIFTFCNMLLAFNMSNYKLLVHRCIHLFYSIFNLYRTQDEYYSYTYHTDFTVRVQYPRYGYNHTHTHTHTHTSHTHKHTHTHTHTHTHQSHTQTHTNTHTVTHSHTHTHTCVCAFMHTFINTYIHQYILIHSFRHTYIHTYIHTFLLR